MSTSLPASNIKNSASLVDVDGGTSTEVGNLCQSEQQSLDSHQDLKASHRIAKYAKYDSDYSHYMRAKYFSKKNLFGGDIYEKKTIGEEIIWASSWSCTQSFVDPVRSFEEFSRCMSITSVEALAISNGKQQKKMD